MPADSQTVLCRYRYDPLDRLVGCMPLGESDLQRFYCKNRLATEIQDQVQRTVFQQGDQLLTQQQRHDGTVVTSLLASDQRRSVLQLVNAEEHQQLVYTAYGYYRTESGLSSLLGFNGERPDPVTGHYLLGNRYRAFNPVLMRFNSPDSWSPYGRGGLNPYMYCLGDPVNLTDPNGHTPWGAVIRLFRRVGLMAPKAPKSAASTPISTVNTVSTQANKTALKLQEGHQLIGYHGTSAEYAQKMQTTGLDPQYIGTGSGLHFGPGFYTTPDMSKALRYANYNAKTMFEKNSAGVIGVYVKNPSTKILNVDYKFIYEAKEVLIKPRMYNDVRIAPVEVTSYSPQPNINKYSKFDQDRTPQRSPSTITKISFS